MTIVVLLALENASAQIVVNAPAETTVLDKELGDATFYASYFEGRVTASGRLFDPGKAMAAHRSYPLGRLCA